MEIQDVPPPDVTGDGPGRGDGPPPDNDQGPQMDPQEAMMVIQKLGIPKEALPILAQALDALEDAGVVPGAAEAPPKKQTIDDAYGAALKQHGMPSPM